MPSRRSQPQGAPTELSEETRLKFAELLTALAAFCIRLLAEVTEALLQSDTLTGAERAALRVAMAGLGPIARQMEAQAAQFRDGLPEQGNQPLTAAGTPTLGAPTLGGAAGRGTARQAPSRTRSAADRHQSRADPPGGLARALLRPPPTPPQKISLDGLRLRMPVSLRYRNQIV